MDKNEVVSQYIDYKKRINSLVKKINSESNDFYTLENNFSEKDKKDILFRKEKINKKINKNENIQNFNNDFIKIQMNFIDSELEGLEKNFVHLIEKKDIDFLEPLFQKAQYLSNLLNKIKKSLKIEFY